MVSESAGDCRNDEELRATRDVLGRSEELFRALTLYSGDIISLLDADGRLLYSSPATERINGFTTEDLEGIDTFELIHPEDRATVQEAYGMVLATPGAVHTVKYRYRTKDGRWLWMEAIASNQLDNPAVRGVVANYATSRRVSRPSKSSAASRVRCSMCRSSRVSACWLVGSPTTSTIC